MQQYMKPGGPEKGFCHRLDLFVGTHLTPTVDGRNPFDNIIQQRCFCYIQTVVSFLIAFLPSPKQDVHIMSVIHPPSSPYQLLGRRLKEFLIAGTAIKASGWLFANFGGGAKCKDLYPPPPKKKKVPHSFVISNGIHGIDCDCNTQVIFM